MTIEVCECFTNVNYCEAIMLNGGNVILKSKTWKLWLLASVGFLFVGMMDVISQEFFRGAMYIFSGGAYLFLSITYYRVNKKSTQIELSDTVLENMNIDLRNLIVEGKKNKAIKKYRMVTGIGLKEAKEYIDNLK